MLPTALKRYLAENIHIRKIVLRFDNDPAGRLAAKTIKTLLLKEYAVEVRLSSRGKDYNDCLCMRLGIPITKRQEKAARTERSISYGR